ncbi:class I SAM-dependent methyltransferase [Gluconacetobacter entanii]|uniref:class I SAM-dependent methyltransferase n=1 Tax=Gluconacetobacter entanii TaxID=108528 RepID=UPI002A5ACA3A|nr:class I SAM-dependent methyltransferase [Gluconacetobacter entanii]
MSEADKMTFISTDFKKGQKKTWDQLASPWNRWIEKFEQAVAPVTNLMLTSSNLKVADSALDLGCGVGEPSLEISRRVGPHGVVVGLDQAPEMLAVARMRAHAQGLTNLTFFAQDLEDFEIQPKRNFNVAFARYSIMFLPSPDSCLRKVNNYLRTGGTISIATWGIPSDVPAISLGFDVLASLLKLPPPPLNMPGPFALSSSSDVGRLLSHCGYTVLKAAHTEVEFQFSDIDEFTHFAWDLLPVWIKKNFEDRFKSRSFELFASGLVDRSSKYITNDGCLCFPGLSPVVTAKKT